MGRFEFLVYHTKHFAKYGAPEGIRTPDLRIRNPMLYPAELRAHDAYSILKLLRFQAPTNKKRPSGRFLIFNQLF